MGLDAVELIMRVEEEFGIEITDGEAEQVATVGGLHKLVVSKIEPQSLNVCLTSVAFFRTRRALMDVLSIPKHRIRPSTAIESVLREQDRAQLWASVRKASSLAMPDLETAWLLYGNQYRSGVETVGDLAGEVLALNYKRLFHEFGGLSEQDAWKPLCAIVVDQLGVKPEQVTAEANFVKDLKID
jgi:acyl carrier protein